MENIAAVDNTKENASSLHRKKNAIDIIIPLERPYAFRIPPRSAAPQPLSQPPSTHEAPPRLLRLILACLADFPSFHNISVGVEHWR